MSGEQVAAEEPWPLSSRWWISFHSKPHPKHSGFDLIEVVATIPDYERKITQFMVPAIDGLICESHSFPSFLIHQNVRAIEAELDMVKEELEKAKKEIKRLRGENENV